MLAFSRWGSGCLLARTRSAGDSEVPNSVRWSFHCRTRASRLRGLALLPSSSRTSDATDSIAKKSRACCFVMVRMARPFETSWLRLLASRSMFSFPLWCAELSYSIATPCSRHRRSHARVWEARSTLVVALAAFGLHGTSAQSFRRSSAYMPQSSNPMSARSCNGTSRAS